MDPVNQELDGTRPSRDMSPFPWRLRPWQSADTGHTPKPLLEDTGEQIGFPGLPLWISIDSTVMRSLKGTPRRSGLPLTSNTLSSLKYLSKMSKRGAHRQLTCAVFVAPGCNLISSAMAAGGTQ